MTQASTTEREAWMGLTSCSSGEEKVGIAKEKKK
jgi:hypothetical protein